MKKFIIAQVATEAHDYKLIRSEYSAAEKRSSGESNGQKYCITDCGTIIYGWYYGVNSYEKAVDQFKVLTYQSLESLFYRG